MQPSGREEGPIPAPTFNKSSQLFAPVGWQLSVPSPPTPSPYWPVLLPQPPAGVGCLHLEAPWASENDRRTDTPGPGSPGFPLAPVILQVRGKHCSLQSAMSIYIHLLCRCAVHSFLFLSSSPPSHDSSETWGCCVVIVISVLPLGLVSWCSDLQGCIK